MPRNGTPVNATPTQQKQALKKRAAGNGTNVAEEIRNAIDAYLSDITADHLNLLDIDTAGRARHRGHERSARCDQSSC